jgi:hypothetical protein
MLDKIKELRTALGLLGCNEAMLHVGDSGVAYVYVKDYAHNAHLFHIFSDTLGKHRVSEIAQKIMQHVKIGDFKVISA